MRGGHDDTHRADSSSVEVQGPTDAAADPPLTRLTDVERPVVLLVDDEAALRALGRRILERHGFIVLEAETGADAMRVARDAGSVDLLVTDLTMPGMSGIELAQRLIREHGGLRVLYLSGCGMHELERIAEGRAASAYLEKPFAPSSLVGKLQELLAGRG
jgi:CheY-like chemotaxis protein